MSHQHDHCCFLALGSMGDVLPLAVLASSLGDAAHKQGAALQVTIITHQIHIARMEFLFPSCPSTTGMPSSLQFLGISTPQLPQCPEQDVMDELEACYTALSRLDPPPSFLCFNLVSKFALHLIELLGSPPCALTSPSIPPPTTTSTRQQDLIKRALLPSHLYSHLPQEWEQDMDLWVLSLFLPIYRDFRRKHGLPDTLFSSSLPPPIPAFYGVSEWLLPKPGYWPAHATFCGPWDDDGKMLSSSTSYTPTSDMACFLGREGPVVCVDFGSMAGLGYPCDWVGVAAMVCYVVHGRGLRAIMLHFPPCVTYDSIRAKLEDANKGRQLPSPSWGAHDTGWLEVTLLLLPMDEWVSHRWLLPKCQAIIHHGGLGTTQTALSCGVPQVIATAGFDQPMWAERVDYLGLGASVGDLSSLTIHKLQGALDRVLNPGVVQTAAMYRDHMMSTTREGLTLATTTLLDLILTKTPKTTTAQGV